MTKAKAREQGRLMQAVRDFAEGRACTMRSAGCQFDAQYSRWAHAPFMSAGKGRGIKAFDLCGAITCGNCDAALDQPRASMTHEERTQIELDFMHAHFRSLVLLLEAGVIGVLK